MYLASCLIRILAESLQTKSQNQKQTSEQFQNNQIPAGFYYLVS